MSKLWHSIENEFDEPVADIIQGLRDQGNSWRTVAGCLGISRSTLLEWRRVLDLPIDRSIQMYDPSSYQKEKPHNHLDFKAQALGFENAVDAVLDLRLRQGMTIKEIAEILDCHCCTITRHTPPEMRGEIYNRSVHWWHIRRRQATEMTMMMQAIRKRRAE